MLRRMAQVDHASHGDQSHRASYSGSADRTRLARDFVHRTRNAVGGRLGARALEQVQAGLSKLRELDRETLEAFYVRGQSLIEMSDEFDAPLGTIKRRLHVARKRLAEEVEPQLV